MKRVFWFALSSFMVAGCGGSTVLVSQLNTTVPRPMLESRVDVPLYVSISEVPDRLTTAGNEGGAKLTEVLELQTFARRDLRRALEGVFTTVAIIDDESALPNTPHYLLRLRIDQIGTEAGSPVGSQPSAIDPEHQMPLYAGHFWIDWAAGLRSHGRPEFLWSHSERTAGTSTFDKKREVPAAVRSALTALLQTIMAGVQETVLSADSPDGSTTIESPPPGPAAPGGGAATGGMPPTPQSSFASLSSRHPARAPRYRKRTLR